VRVLKRGGEFVVRHEVKTRKENIILMSEQEARLDTQVNQRDRRGWIEIRMHKPKKGGIDTHDSKEDHRPQNLMCYRSHCMFRMGGYLN